MNEQRLADLFSEQVDRLLHGESTDVPSDAGDLQELLDIVGKPTSQTQFRASSTALAAFQNQMVSWFGSLANGGSLMTILGLSKTWLFSIITTIIIFVTGAAIIAVVATSIVVVNSGSELPAPPPPDDQDPPPNDQDPPPDDQDPPPDDQDPPPDEPFTIIFVNNIQITSLCQGIYTTQSALVNSGDFPVTDVSLVSEVIDGEGLVDTVDISSPDLDDSLIFNSISAQQEVKLKIKVKVKDDWWEQDDGTKIKVKLSVKGDHDRGHGNDPDGFDEDNPGRGHRRNNGSSQIITIVNQSAQWVTLTGVAHDNGDGTLLVDGTTVTMDDCTGLPSTIAIGSNVQVIGLLQPDGTFVAINIIIINTTVIGDFDSGVPVGDDDDDDGDGGGKGGSKGGSKKGGSGGSGGSKGK